MRGNRAPSWLSPGSSCCAPLFPAIWSFRSFRREHWVHTLFCPMWAGWGSGSFLPCWYPALIFILLFSLFSDRGALFPDCRRQVLHALLGSPAHPWAPMGSPVFLCPPMLSHVSHPAFLSGQGMRDSHRRPRSDINDSVINWGQ